MIKSAQLTPETRERLFDLLKPSSPYKRFMDKATSRLKTFNKQWEKGLRYWEKWLGERKKKGGEK